MFSSVQCQWCSPAPRGGIYHSLLIIYDDVFRCQYSKSSDANRSFIQLGTRLGPCQWRNVMKYAIVFLVSFLNLCTTAYAQTTSPPRLRPLIHAGYEFGEGTLELRGHFVVAGNLLAPELSPHLYLGVGWKPVKWFDIECDIGLDFRGAEPKISLKPSVNHENFWTWAELDMQFPSYNGYWFIQLQYKLHNAVHVGIEGEGWGNWGKPLSWSNGAGPNVLLRLGSHVGVDLALHLREGPGDDGRTWGFDPFVRFHLFL